MKIEKIPHLDQADFLTNIDYITHTLNEVIERLNELSDTPTT